MTTPQHWFEPEMIVAVKRLMRTAFRAGENKGAGKAAGDLEDYAFFKNTERELTKLYEGVREEEIRFYESGRCPETERDCDEERADIKGWL